jgi:predicted PurR-regulated permease PerM
VAKAAPPAAHLSQHLSNHRLLLSPHGRQGIGRRHGEHDVSERERTGQEQSLAAAVPVVRAARQVVARRRATIQVVLGVLFGLGILGLLYWGREALPPFLLGLIVAYMLLPLVRRVERMLPYGGMWTTLRRPIAALIVFFGALLVLAILLRSLAQPVIEQTAQILDSLEELWAEAQANAPQIRAWYEQNVPEMARGWVDDGFETLGRTVLAVSGSVGGWLISFTGSALSSVVSFIAVPLFIIYFLIDEPKISRQIREQFPRAWAGDTLALTHIFNRIFGSYTRGVIIESVIVGVITGLGYFLIGVEVWLPLGVIALFGEIVPIIGPWIAFFISLPVILATQPDRAIAALGLFVIIQMLEGWFLAPRIQGGSVHFTSSATLLILAVGGAIAGAMGVILALPTAALLRDLSFYVSYRASGLSPTEAMGELPSFQRESEQTSSPRPEVAIPPATP